MLQIRSRLDVADNTGARMATMIGVIGKGNAPMRRHRRRHHRQRQGSQPDGTVKKGEVVRAVMVRTRQPIRREDGRYLRFDNNAIVIIDKDLNPRGTRIFGPVARELREQQFHEDRLARSGGALYEPAEAFHVKRATRSRSSPATHRVPPARSSQVISPQAAVLIEGVRMIKKHMQKSQDNPQGAIIEREGPIHISNVKLVERSEKKPKSKSRRKGDEGKRRRKQWLSNGRTNFISDYKERVMPALREKHGYKNVHQIPKVEKVVVNTSRRLAIQT